MAENKKQNIERAPDIEKGRLEQGYRNFIDAEVEKGAETKWKNLPDTLRELADKVFDEDKATAEIFAEELLDNAKTMLGLKIFRTAAKRIESVKIEGNTVRFLDKNGEVVKLAPGEYAESEYTLEFPVKGSDRLIEQAKKAELLEKNADLRGKFLNDEFSDDTRATHLRETAALHRLERRGMANLREREATESFRREQQAGGPASAETPRGGEEGTDGEGGKEKTPETLKEPEFLTAGEAEKIVAMRAELDRDLAKAWVVDNQPFEEIADPLGRAKLIPALKPEPLAMGPAQLRRMLRENHQISTLTMQDFLSEHGLNLETSATTLKIEYLDLINRKDILRKEETERLHWLDSLFKQVKSVLDIVGDKDIFYAREFKRADVKKEELSEDETDRKILEKLADIFDPSMRGYLDERTGRIMDVVDVDNRVHTALKEDYLTASGEAMYEHTRKKIWTEAATPEARFAKTNEILNIYLKLALINEKRDGEYEKLEIKDLSVSDEVKHLLRKGYQNHRLIEASMLREEHESVYSAEEHLQKLGERIKERYSLTHKETRELIRKVEQHLIGGVMAGVVYDRTENEFGPILGVAGNIDLGKGWNLHVGISGVKPPEETDWRTHLNVGGTYHFKPEKDYSMDISIGYAHRISGATESGIGAGVRVSIPVEKENDLVLGLGAGTPLTTLRLFPTGEIGSSWNPERAFENKKAKFEELLKNPDNKKFYEDFKANHSELFQQFEKMLAAYSGTEKAPVLSDDMKAALARTWIETLNRKASDLAIEELESPSIPDYGIVLVAAPPGILGVPVIPVPYFTISLGGETKVIRVMSRESMEIPDEVFLKKLQEQRVDIKNAEIVHIAEDGPIALDQEGRPRILSKGDAAYEFSEVNSLQNLNETFRKIGLTFTQESDKLLRISIENAERSTVNVHLDPALEDISLVYDQRDFYLSLSAKKELVVTRIDYEYPFPHKGSVRGIELFIKAGPERRESVIREKERAFLERLQNGLIREGGDKTKLQENNIWGKEEFGDRGNAFEIIDLQPSKDAAERIFSATHLRETQEIGIRENLEALIKEFYQKGNKKRIASLMTEYDPTVKYDPKELIGEINSFLEKRTVSEAPLTDRNPLEIMFAWNILTELTLRDLQKEYDRLPAKVRSKKGFDAFRRAQIERDVKAFVKKDLVTLFRMTSQTDNAEKMADLLVKQMRETTFRNDEERVSITPETTGNLFLTMVRHFQIRGLRRSLDYRGREYVLINPEEYRSNDTDPIKKSIAIAILELQSPLKDKEKTHEYLNQILPLKLAKFAPLIMDASHMQALADLYEAKEDADSIMNLKPEYKEALDEFKKFVNAVREAEKSGAESIPHNGPFGAFELQFTGVKTTAGIFERCGNFTIVAKENFSAALSQKLPSHLGVGEKAMVTVEAEKVKEFYKMALLFPFAVQEKVARAPKPKPKGAHEGSVDTPESPEGQPPGIDTGVESDVTPHETPDI